MSTNYRKLRYSIRKRGEDEIEIRHSLCDGYIRGFFRTILLGMFLVGSYIDMSHMVDPFKYEIQEIQKKIYWVIAPDKVTYPEYQEYKERGDIAYKYQLKDEILKEIATPPSSYEEYKKDIMPESPIKDLILSLLWLPIVLALIFYPRPRGLRINRKKRLIYWQYFYGRHFVAYVLEKADPLGGIVYNKFGLYAFGGHKHFSLQIWLKDFVTKRPIGMVYGVYPTPNAKHNDDILNAIRAYLSEDNPEFLNHIGNRYGVFGLHPMITLCNAFTWGIPFQRKKAEKATNEALAVWQKATAKEKKEWFENIANEQQSLNERLSLEGLDNQIKK